MTSSDQPYDARNVYDHEASGREPMPGLYGGWHESVVEWEELEITPDIRLHATYLSPYRMDHIAELHAGRASVPDINKSLFPAAWTDDKIFEAVRAIVTDPDATWSREADALKGGRPGTLMNPWHDRDDVEWEIPARLRVDGDYDGIRIRVIVEPEGEGIITAYTRPPKH
ncbi:EndoU domain-containing protein [Nocardia fluminea]